MFGLSNSSDLNEMLTKLKIQCKAIDVKPDFDDNVIFDLFHFGSVTPDIGHWILFIKISNDSCIIIDSYGVYHETLLKELMNKYKNVLVVLDQQQDLKSQSCGYYSILNCYLIERGLYQPENYLLIQNGYYKLVTKNINENRYNKYEKIYQEYDL